MTRYFVTAGILLSLATTARADIDPNDISIRSFNPEDAVAPVSSVEGPGVKIGEGTVMRPVFGMETGFVSNVFYEDTNTAGSGVLRLLAQVGIASYGRDRLQKNGTDSDQQEDEQAHGAIEYRANLRASYDFMLSGNDTVTETGGLGLGGSFSGLINPAGRFSLGIEEDFVRLIRAANFETDANTNRDINSLRLIGLYHPRDRSISGYLYYDNKIDVFERSEQSFADRMTNRFGIHPIWQWLPQTQLYLDVSIANVMGIGGDAMKVTSYPLRTTAGLNTLLTLKTTFNLEAGYTNGFYSAGPSFSAPVIGANLGYRYSPLGRVTLGYQWMYEDSINANYYRDHVFRASVQQLVHPVVFMVQPEIHLRQYNGVSFAVPGITGPDVRDDVIIAVIAGVHYSFRNWIAATLNYRFTSVQTDYVTQVMGGMADDPSFVRHELLLGVRAAL
jgi:hypothetical protein